MKHALLPLLLLALPAYAQVAWTELAGSATGGGLSQTPDTPSMEPGVAVSPAGTIYVTWTEWTAEGQEVHVFKWNGPKNAWIELGAGLGNPASNALSCYPQIRVGSNEKPVVAWVGGAGVFGGHILLLRWTGSLWEELGGSATGAGLSPDGADLDTSPSLALDTLGNPVVAWQGQVGFGSHVYVRGWNGSAWQDWASSSTAGIDAGLTGSVQPSIAVDSQNRPWVAFFANPTILFLTAELRVRHWTGAAWEDVGHDKVTPTQFALQKPSLALDSVDTPIVAWCYPAQDENKVNWRYVMVKRWDGQAWVGLATNPAVAANAADVWPSPVIRMGPANEALVTWLGDGNVVYLKSHKAGAADWTPVGESFDQGGLSGMSGIPSSQHTLAIGSSGLVAVAWVDTLQGAQGNAGEVRLKQAMLGSGALAWSLAQSAGGDPKIPLPVGHAVSAGGAVFLGGNFLAAGEEKATFEIEVRPAKTGFLGEATQSSLSLLAPNFCSVAIPALAKGDYHWQARVKTASGATSPWVSFGENAEDATDFSMDADPLPPPPPPVEDLPVEAKKKDRCAGATGAMSALLPLSLLLAATLVVSRH